MIALLFFVCVNVIVAAFCWDVLTSPEKFNIHWRLTALWAFLANMAVFGFNFWLFLSLMR